jgi:serpin B
MVKSFKDARFKFAAILPNEGVSLETYVNQMTGDSFLKLMNSTGKERADCWLPKFKYEYSAELSDPLKALGLTDAFNSGLADFKQMGSTSQGNLSIGSVLHKTFIEVDEAGTKAGAATEVTMVSSSAGPTAEPKKIVFDRPFVYAIIDTQTKLPIFIGTVNNPSK